MRQCVKERMSPCMCVCHTLSLSVSISVYLCVREWESACVCLSVRKWACEKVSMRKRNCVKTIQRSRHQYKTTKMLCENDKLCVPRHVSVSLDRSLFMYVGLLTLFLVSSERPFFSYVCLFPHVWAGVSQNMRSNLIGHIIGLFSCVWVSFDM